MVEKSTLVKTSFIFYFSFKIDISKKITINSDYKIKNLIQSLVLLLRV